MNTDKNTARFLGAAFLFVAAASALSGLILSSLGIGIWLISKGFKSSAHAATSGSANTDITGIK